MPFSIDDQQLSDLFTELDIGIKSAKVITKPNYRKNGAAPRRSKGYGFVEANDQEQQQKAIEKLKEHRLGDRELTIKIANERKLLEENPESLKNEDQSAQTTPDAQQALTSV